MNMQQANHNSRKIRKGSNAEQLMRTLAAGTGIIILSLVAPQASALIVQKIISGYFRRKRFERERFLRDLKNLQARKLIQYQELENEKVKIVLTKTGKTKALLYRLDEMRLKIPKRWDRKWRLILFDIPHTQKRARDALRAKLMQLGFYPLQKSAFLTPYPCGDEIDFITSIFDIRRYVLLLTISDFEGAEKLRHHFGIEAA